MNDTVVIYDRIRENLFKYTKISISDIANLSINETLARTLITSVTTLLALTSIYILGGEILRGFSFAMILGVIIGALFFDVWGANTTFIKTMSIFLWTIIFWTSPFPSSCKR